MANSKKTKKNFWYIIVLANDGARFITSLDYSTKYARWEKNEKPLEMSESTSKDIALGLALNGYTAFPVCSLYELDRQPYLYNKGSFKWVWNDENENEEQENENK